MNTIFSWFIKSDFVKAQILAVVRHVVTAAGVALVAKGYADDSVVQGALGLATTAVSFWLANMDVKKVDQKIDAALNTVPPQYVNQISNDKVEVRELPPI